MLNGKIVGRWKHKNGKMTFELFEAVSAESEKIISETAERYFAVNKILFDAHVAVGFTSEEAFAMTLATLDCK